MQKLQKENWTLREKSPNCAIWQPVPGVLCAVRALNEPRWVSVLLAGCRCSLLTQQTAMGGSLFAERIQQNYLQWSNSTVNVCHCLFGGCPVPVPNHTMAPRSQFPFPQPRQPDFSHTVRGNPHPITALQQEKHRRKHKAAFRKTAIAHSGFALKKEHAELKNVPRTTRMALLYFHKEVSPNCTLTVFFRTNLFPPNADSHRSLSVCVCWGDDGGAALWHCLYVSCLCWWNYCLFF